MPPDVSPPMLFADMQGARAKHMYGCLQVRLRKRENPKPCHLLSLGTEGRSFVATLPRRAPGKNQTFLSPPGWYNCV